MQYMAMTILSQKDDIFQSVKEIPFLEVQRAFYGAEVRRDKIRCPFHQDKSPSLHIYPDGFKCYGCGEAGDSIDFVAKLLTLPVLDAAKAIAHEFNIPVKEGPLTREERFELAQAKARRLQEKRLREAFKSWTRLAGRQVRATAEIIRLQLEEKGVDIDDNLLYLVQELPRLEHWADILTEGSEKEIITLYRDPDFRRWFMC